MNSDATEAALGLLGLSPLNASQSQSQSHPQPQPHTQHHVAHPHGPSLTSPSVGIAIDPSSIPHIVQSPLPPSLVPLKRKQPSPAPTPLTLKPRQTPLPPPASALPSVFPNASAKTSIAPSQRHPQQRMISPVLTGALLPQTPPSSLASPSTSHPPLALADAPPPPDSEAISCICGFTFDDGFSIACDDCSRWCHAACFGIVQGGVPDIWKCWLCDPTLEVDKERAVKLQKGRWRTMRTKASHAANGGGLTTNGGAANSAQDEGSGNGKPASKRKTSPGVERKSRRGSAVAAAIEGSRKKRRAFMLSPANPSSPSILASSHTPTPLPPANSRISHPNGNGPVPCSNAPPTPMTFPPDTYPNPSVYAQLLRVAKAWRGVTALNPPSPLIHPPPKTYSDRGYTRVDSQGYQDRYGYSMSPLDNTTPVMLDENVADQFVPRTMLRTDPPMSCPFPPASAAYSPANLRPPSPRLHVASDPSPFLHTSIYPSPPTSNYMSPLVPSSSHPRPYVKSPLAPSTNTISSSNPNNTIPASTLLAPYTASIVPSAAYLADPLNGYAHLGMGKPQVRLVGGGWGVGLDTRSMGGVPESDSGEKGSGVNANTEEIVDAKAKWARCGCWPNAVVRPVICGGTKGGKSKRGVRHKAECAMAAPNGTACDPSHPVNGRSTPTPMSPTPGQPVDDSSDQDDSPLASDSDTDSMSLSFALFALRDLRADEEIVLGWEWDDGHAVHMLPALMESPGIFAPAHLHHLRAQFTSILHALSSTFTTCACGSSTRDCAVRVMERVVEGQWPWPGEEMTSEGSEGESSDANGISEEMEDVEGDVDVEGDDHVGPHQGPKWGLGMNVDVDIAIDTSIEVNRVTRPAKRKVRKKNKASGTTLLERGKDEAAVPAPTAATNARKTVDLGPLVGVKRGFRTREKVPMNGGWGGVEIVPSSLKPSPEAGPEEEPPVDVKGKGKARVADDKDDMDVDPSPSTLPPRMRKAWSRAVGGELETGNTPQDRSYHTDHWRTHDRWRSPPDVTIDSPISPSGTAEGSSNQQHGPKQSSVGANGEGEDAADEQETEFDTETEVDGSDDTRQMPPPPMPASLDPTTVSSLAHAHTVRSSSPHRSAQQDKDSLSTTRIPSSQPSSQGTYLAAPTPSTSSSSLHSSTSVQSHLAAPAPSVSPSSTFSQLSLHSPDASSHLSTLLSTMDTARLPFAPTSTQHSSDPRASSPPVHRPSKPLHVHPHNESPSFPASLADGVRDTPAEAQYQQPYRSSPEAREEPQPPAEVKRPPSNGELHRVRFASPEILSGLPGLKGQTASSNSEPAQDDPVDTSATMVIDGSDVGPSDRDAMDVDVDVVGDNPRGDSGGPSHVTSPEKRIDPGSPVHECPSFPTPGSPRLQIPPDPSSPNVSTLDDLEPKNESQPQPPEDVMPPVDSSEHEPVESVREPSPLPQPKVKMSLKDFALRKKKQREEEMAAKALRSPGTPEGSGLPFSPNLDVKRDLTDSDDTVNGHDVKMHDGTQDSSSAPDVRTNGFDARGGQEHDGRHEVKGTAEDDKRSIRAQVPSAINAVNVLDATPALPQLAPSSTSSRVRRENYSAGRAQTPMNGALSTTLTAKVEIMDAVVPSEPASVDDRTPDVVSFAPEPPPPPSAVKSTNESMVDFAISTRRSDPPLTCASTPTSMSTSTSTVNSRSNSVSIPNFSSNAASFGPIPTLSSSDVSSRRPSHEDGEITSSISSKSYSAQSHTPPTQPRSFHTVRPPSPNYGQTSSSTPPVSRRPPPPLSRSPLSNGNGPSVAPISSRPLPSGPRALRGSMTQSSHSSYSSTRPSYSGSQYIPRGPSADRDRVDWERGDRQWSTQVRSRGRAGSNGWGR